MKEEVLAAVMFFVNFIEKSESFPREQLENFKKHLTDVLMARFEKHWFPDLPTKGQGYRCIRINGFSPTDFCLELAASKCGLRYTDLRLPHELTVWVDPSEVCYRLGECEGSYCTLATFPLDVSSSSLDSSTCSTPVSTPPSTPTSSPTQERTRKVQKSNQPRYQHPNYIQQHHQQQQSADFAINRFRNQSNVLHQTPSQSSSMRAKNSSRDIHYFNPNRPMYRCDGPPYPLTPTFYRNMNYSSRNHYKNILRV